MNVITHTFVGLKCLTETKIQILCDHVSHTRLHTVEMGCQMVQLLSAHIVGPTMCVNLTLAFDSGDRQMIYTIIISLLIEKPFYLLRPQSFSFQIASEFIDTFLKFSNFIF